MILLEFELRGRNDEDVAAAVSALKIHQIGFVLVTSSGANEGEVWVEGIILNHDLTDTDLSDVFRHRQWLTMAQQEDMLTQHWSMARIQQEIANNWPEDGC